MVVPVYDIDEGVGFPLDSDPGLDNRDARTRLVLGEPLSAGVFDAQRQPEPLVGGGDGLTVVLRSGEHVRCRG